MAPSASVYAHGVWSLDAPMNISLPLIVQSNESMYSFSRHPLTPLKVLLVQSRVLMGVGSVPHEPPHDAPTTVRRLNWTLRETSTDARVLTTLLCHAGQYGPSYLVGPIGRPMLTYPGVTTGCSESHAEMP